MKLLKLTSVLLVNLFWISSVATGDVLIKLGDTNQKWYIGKCRLVGDVWKVTNCGSKKECDGTYEKSEYSCQRGDDCGVRWLFGNSNPTVSRVVKLGDNRSIEFFPLTARIDSKSVTRDFQESIASYKVGIPAAGLSVKEAEK